MCPEYWWGEPVPGCRPTHITILRLTPAHFSQGHPFDHIGHMSPWVVFQEPSAFPSLPFINPALPFVVRAMPLTTEKKNRDRERETSIVRKKGVGFLKGRWHSHSTAQEGSQSFRSSAPACWAPWTAIVVNLTSSQRRPNCLSIKLRQQIHNTMFLEINTTWNHNLYCLLSQYTHSWLFIVHVIAQKENVCLCSLLSGCNPFLCLQTGWCHLSLLFLRPIWCLLSTIQSIPYGQDQVFNWWKLSCFSWPCIQSLLANTESHAKHIFSSVQTSMCFLRLVYAS